MGLLDQAIREHLELKRRHGADPREIAIAEREALLPISDGRLPAWALAAPQTSAAVPDPNDTATPAEAVQSPPYDWTAAGAPLDGEPARQWGASDGAQGGPQDGALEDASEAQEETQELDMGAVLGLGELEIPGEVGLGMVHAERITDPASAVAPADGHRRGRSHSQEESFEWHVIPRGERHGSQELPAQSTLALE